MVIIPRHKGAVAEWVFDDGSIKHLLWPTLEQSLVVCSNVSSTLKTHKLLDPYMVRLSQWMHAGPHDVIQGRRIDKNGINIEVDPESSLTQILPQCRVLVENEKVYPLTIEIFGRGTVFTNQGDSLVEDLTWVRATALEIFRISIGTQSDSWLPFSLKGEPQKHIYDLNAERMVSPLQEIRQNTGFKLEKGIDSRYAIIDGFRLDNIRYSDGSIVDVT